MDCPSPNFDERKLPVSMIVIHYTETKTCEQALRILCDPNAAKRVSAHWLIDRDGTIYRLVDEAKRAWHAGKSFWDGIEDCNSASIGIELVNDGKEEYPEPQLAALVELCAEIKSRHAIRHIVGHSDIAPGRKRDPGPLFPWGRLDGTTTGVPPRTPIAGHPQGAGGFPPVVVRCKHEASIR